MEIIEIMGSIKMNQLQAFVRLNSDPNHDWPFSYTKR